MDVRMSLAAFAFVISAPAVSAELVVSVAGVPSDQGEVGCALYNTADGFPTDQGKATLQWRSARRAGVTCSFEGLRPGAYAVAVSHDANGNRRVDTNVVGFPTEAWGVSNGVRPTLRAPRFAEARFEVAEGAAARISVRIAK